MKFPEIKEEYFAGRWYVLRNTLYVNKPCHCDERAVRWRSNRILYRAKMPGCILSELWFNWFNEYYDYFSKPKEVSVTLRHSKCGASGLTAYCLNTIFLI